MSKLEQMDKALVLAPLLELTENLRNFKLYYKVPSDNY